MFRENIITNMCYTYRHDYGLNKLDALDVLSPGTTEQERQIIWNMMAQIFDNDILPHMKFKIPDSRKYCGNE
jgi:hypothetical protein